MALGAGVANFVRVRDGALTPPQKELMAGENHVTHQKREETPHRKGHPDEHEKNRPRQQNQLNQQTQGVPPSDHRYRSSGFQKEQQLMVDSGRQAIADRARVKLPVTKLGSNPTTIRKADIGGHSQTMSPPQIAETVRTTEGSTYKPDDGRPFYETDAENFDNTTNFSDETRSKDDERKPQGTELNPNGFSYDRLISNSEMVMADPTDGRHLERYPVNQENGSYVEEDSTSDEEEGEDTEDGQSYEGSYHEMAAEIAQHIDGSSSQLPLSAMDMVNLQKEAVVAKAFQVLPTSSRVPLQSLNGIVIPITNQPTYRHGLTGPYSSTALSKAHDYAANPQVRTNTPPQSQPMVSRHHAGHHSMTRSNQPPKEHRADKGQPTRNKTIDQQDLQYSNQQTRADRPTQMSTQVRHDSPMRLDPPQEEEQLTHPMFDHGEIREEDIAADSIDILGPRSPSPIVLEVPSTPTQKRPLELDYDPDQLSEMTYADLKSESFDHDPRAPTDILPESLASAPLAHRLEYIHDQAKHGDVPIEQQRAFFCSLPIDEYEECGDLIVERFAAIIAKFKDARREKRKVATTFEEEIARREEGVRGKREAIERDMGRLRKAGEDVVKGKGA
ncbi:MAG: hypothetical protein Q9187_005421 [Circinaria calcarea]